MLRKRTRLRRPLRQRLRFLAGWFVTAGVLSVIPVSYWSQLSEQEQTVLLALCAGLLVVGTWWAWDESGRDHE